MTSAIITCQLCGLASVAHEEREMTEHVRTEHKKGPGLYLRMTLDDRVVRPIHCSACARTVFVDEDTCHHCGAVTPYARYREEQRRGIMA